MTMPRPSKAIVKGWKQHYQHQLRPKRKPAEASTRVSWWTVAAKPDQREAFMQLANQKRTEYEIERTKAIARYPRLGHRT